MIKNLLACLILIFSSATFGLTCEGLFQPRLSSSIVSGKLPEWAHRLSPKTQFEHYGAMILKTTPKLTETQSEALLQAVIKAPEGQIAATSIGDLKGIDATTKIALAEWVQGLVQLMGRDADYILLRAQNGNQVFEGHVHEAWSFATATTTLYGPGTYFDSGGERYQLGSRQTVILRDGVHGIFHGTPRFSGPRLFIGVSFLHYWP